MADVPRRVMAAYGAPSLALALLGVSVFVHLPRFYGDVAGASLGVLGLAILVTRLWDAVLDPAVGAWSDRTRTRFGRRRPFLLLTPVPMAAAIVLLFAPPASLAGGAVAAYYAVVMALVFLGWTLIAIPHASLGPELTSDHHARTRLFAVREALWIAGTLGAAAAPMAVRAWWGSGGAPADERTVFATLGWIYAALLVLLTWGCAFAVRERVEPTQVPTARPRWTELRENRPFRVLIAAYAVGAVGGGLPATLILYYVEHVLQAASVADLFLGLYFLSGFICLPAWLHLARRIGKKPAWMGAMAVSVVAFSGALFLGPGDTTAYAVIVVLSGTGFGAGLVLPASMQADTIDYAEAQHGSRREGAYLGLWSIVMKASAAAGAAVALPLLGLAGYVPGEVQSPAVVLTLKVLYAGVPCLTYAAAMVIAARYPIDEAGHARILEAIRARRSVGPAADREPAGGAWSAVTGTSPGPA